MLKVLCLIAIIVIAAILWRQVTTRIRKARRKNVERARTDNANRQARLDAKDEYYYAPTDYLRRPSQPRFHSQPTTKRQDGTYAVGGEIAASEDAPSGFVYDTFPSTKESSSSSSDSESSSSTSD